MQQHAASKISQAILQGSALLSPPPPRTADQWADQCRILPPGSAEPGPWRSARTPYMIPILRAASDPQYRRIVVVCGAQMGKTEGTLNILGHRLDDDPVPMLYIGPTQKQAESMSSDRVTKMLQSVPSLWEKLAKGKKNKITEKFVSGVRLGFGWAGSATELSSHPAGLVLVDERDRMGDDTAGEGDPVSLAEARTATFPDGKVIVVSTPTLEGASPIWALYEEGTRCRWAWPCPDCGEYFVPRFELLKWPEGCTPHQALKDTRLACPACGSLIEDTHRPTMNRLGRYAPDGASVDAATGELVGELPDSDTASFWVSGLCSPWRTWGQRAKAFLEANNAKTPGRVQAVINTAFGELYRMSGEAPDWTRVRDRRGAYESGTVPEGVQFLTCGVDVQKDRLVYAVRGWGVGSESWLIEHGELWGETEHDHVWSRLGDLLQRDFGTRRITRMLIDSGYKPGASRGSDNQIYLFCRRFRAVALPTKGHDRQEKPLKASKIDVSSRGQVIKHGLQLWHLDSDYFKSWVHARIEWPEDQPGGWHLCRDATDDYCQQLVAEQRLAKPSGRVVWIKTRRDNHYLDAEALNVAAAHLLNVHNLLPPKPADTAKPARNPLLPRRVGGVGRRW